MIRAPLSVGLRGRLAVLLAMTLTTSRLVAQYSETKLRNPQANNITGELGQSVAIDDDTMIVGARRTETQAGTQAGVAIVYRADGFGGWREEGRLAAPDAGPSDFFGYSVAVSGDMAVVGAYLHEDAGDDTGASYVFRRSGTQWQFERRLTADDARDDAFFGWSVAIDGNYVLVGARGDDGEGSAYVFERHGGVWTQRQKLRATFGSAGDGFGSSVSISGNTALVGAYRDDDGGQNRGSAFVFTRSGTIWTTQQKLAPSDGVASDLFGSSVSISGDALVVGAPRNEASGNEGSGAAYVFERTADVWSESAILAGADQSVTDRFGSSVSISGNTLVVGSRSAVESGTSVGAAVAYSRVAGTWTLEQRILSPSQPPFGLFGCGVAISGSSLAIGDYGEDNGGITNTGAAYAFVRTTGVWASQARLTPMDNGIAIDDAFGTAVSLSGDTAIAGAPGDDGAVAGAGSASVFARDGNEWNLQQRIVAPDGALDDLFGESVAVSGNTAVVGAWGDDDAGTNAGAAYVFTRSGTAWTMQQRLSASDATAFDHFGERVAIHGDTILVGAMFNDDAGSNSGSVYAFKRAAGVWTQQAKLVAGDAATEDFFGCSVSISGDTAFVGAYGNDDSGSFSGSAYVFGRSGSTWTQQGKLGATGASAGDNFGWSVAVSGNTFVVGAYQDDIAAADGGSAFVFIRSGNGFLPQATLTAADASAGDRLGWSVAVEGDSILVGADASGTGGDANGSAYLFRRSGGLWTESHRFVRSDAAEEDAFGHSLSISDGRLLVGSYRDNDPEVDAGSAYVFEFDPSSAAGDGWTAYP